MQGRDDQKLTQERLRELLSYDPNTGHFYWLETGKKAGCLDVRGYIVIRIDRALYRAARLAWLFMVGEWPPHQVDHKNQIRSDDYWSNLRLATNSQNNRNKTLPKANTSGYRGVSWNKRGQRWFAQIKINYRNIYLGSFSSREDAHLAYVKASEKFHGEFGRPNE